MSVVSRTQGKTLERKVVGVVPHVGTQDMEPRVLTRNPRKKSTYRFPVEMDTQCEPTTQRQDTSVLRLHTLRVWTVESTIRIRVV